MHAEFVNVIEEVPVDVVLIEETAEETAEEATSETTYFYMEDGVIAPAETPCESGRNQNGMISKDFFLLYKIYNIKFCLFLSFIEDLLLIMPF